jgi:hypothetical protein
MKRPEGALHGTSDTVVSAKRCRMKSKGIDLRIKQQPELTPLQRRAYELLGLLPENGK